MARNLVWQDLGAEHLESIRHPHPKKGLTGRDLLAKFSGISDPKNTKSAITLDLYVHALQYAQEQRFADDKTSGFFSIVKSVHMKSIEERLTVERSFEYFKDLMLYHSVQRPPYSVGLFTLGEMQRAMQWMLDTYYRHYKLYMYTFTDRVTMSVVTVHPSDSVELPPELPPLNDALTEEQHMAQLDEEQRQREQEQRAAEEAAAAAAEEARQQRIREEYEATIADDIKSRVTAAVEAELALLRSDMENKFTKQQSVLLARIAELESAQGGAASPQGSTAGHAPEPHK